MPVENVLNNTVTLMYFRFPALLLLLFLLQYLPVLGKNL